MDGLEEKLEAMLKDPGLMESVMAMAKNLSTASPPPSPPRAQDNPLGNLDPAMLQKIAGLAQQGTIDSQQQNLLKALNPYLSHRRLHKLERAMRAAKMAKIASSFISAGGLQMLSGR